MFANADMNRLNIHCGLQNLSFCTAGLFSAAFLLRHGMPPAQIFAAFGAILVFRFIMRPAVLFVAPRFGLKRMFMIAGACNGLPYLLLAGVTQIDARVLLYCLVSAATNVFYWTAFHAFYGALNESPSLGRQIALRQTLMTAAGVGGPALGGFALTFLGPWAAFGAAALLSLLSVIPLFPVTEPNVLRDAPPGAWREARTATLIFVTDGWLNSSAGTAWALILFGAVGSRYDAYGAALAAAAGAGAAGGLLLGRLIDLGHGRRAVIFNAALLAGVYLAQILSGSDTFAVIAVALATTALGGFYSPTVMSVVYGQSRQAACPFRFQFAAEGGWDVGGSSACFLCAALFAAGAPLQAGILIALPAVFAQARILLGAYGAKDTVVAAGAA